MNIQKTFLGQFCHFLLQPQFLHLFKFPLFSPDLANLLGVKRFEQLFSSTIHERSRIRKHMHHMIKIPS